MEPVPCSDEELVRRACAGHTDAFGALVERHQDRIYNAVAYLVGAAHDAEDLTQEVFLKAYRSINGFKGKATFSTWLYSIMLNCVRTHWRRTGRRAQVVSLNAAQGDDDHPLSDPPSTAEGPFEEVLRRETVESVRMAIGELPAELREVIVLRDLEGLSYEQLAVSLRLPLGTVKSRLYRARSALKDKITPMRDKES